MGILSNMLENKFCTWCADWGWKVRAKIHLGTEYLCNDHEQQYMLELSKRMPRVNVQS